MPDSKLMHEKPDDPSHAELNEQLIFGSPTSRRRFLQLAAAAGLAVEFGRISFASAATEEASAAGTPLAAGEHAMEVKFKVNGREQSLRLDPRVSLLDALRDHLQLTGTKKGCDHGQCGACTVLVNGRRINSCLSLAVTHEGDEVTTVEGLANGAQLSPIQAAFIEHDAFQCGYCTPGQLCSATALLAEGKTRNDGEIREWMSGNLCRCGAYTNIVAAIRECAAKTGARA